MIFLIVIVYGIFNSDEIPRKFLVNNNSQVSSQFAAFRTTQVLKSTDEKDGSKSVKEAIEDHVTEENEAKIMQLQKLTHK
jgi:hypothetical protein